MSVLDYEVKLRTRFSCAQPQDASPYGKRSSSLPAVYDARKPHVIVDAVIGTRGLFVERTDANFYQGHVPDAPILLGQAQTEIYKTAVESMSWSAGRGAAVAAAVLLGAIVGAVVAGAVIGASALALAALPALGGSLHLAPCLWMTAVYMGCGALLLAVSEAKAWRETSAKLSQMVDLSENASRIMGGVARPDEKQDVDAKILAALNGSDWLIQQAAYEFEGICQQPRAFEIRKAG